MAIRIIQIVTLVALAVAGFLFWNRGITIGWVIGMWLGLILLWGDEIAGYKWYQESVVPSIPGPTQNNYYLVTRSALFLLTLVPVSFYVVTSTSSALGWGLVSSLMFSIAIEMLWYRNSVLELHQRYFKSHPRISTQTLKWLPWVWSGLTIIMLLFLFL